MLTMGMEIGNISKKTKGNIVFFVPFRKQKKYQESAEKHFHVSVSLVGQAYTVC